MKAIVVGSFGGPEVLRATSVPAPTAPSGQVVVAVEAAGVGLVDALARQGMYPGISEPGFVPGAEVAGTVVALGQGVDEIWLNRRVFGVVGTGGYSEQIAVNVAQLTPLPDNISPVDAVGLGVNALVASLAVKRACLKAGERVLVRGAGGGIGVMTTQVAARSMAVITAATSSAERGRRLMELGASTIVDRITGVDQPESEYDFVLDPVGGLDMGKYIAQLSINGRYILCGFAGGFPEPNFGMGLLANFQKSASFSTLSLDPTDPSLHGHMAEIFALAASGSLRPIVDQVLSLESASEAHVKLASGSVFGKLILTTGTK